MKTSIPPIFNMEYFHETPYVGTFCRENVSHNGKSKEEGRGQTTLPPFGSSSYLLLIKFHANGCIFKLEFCHVKKFQCEVSFVQNLKVKTLSLSSSSIVGNYV